MSDVEADFGKQTEFLPFVLYCIGVDLFQPRQAEEVITLAKVI